MRLSLLTPIVLALAGTSVPPPTTPPVRVPRFPLAGLFVAEPDPVVPNGATGAWDDVFLDPGAVVVDTAGVVHMFYNGFNTFPGPVGMGYARSTDHGTTFTKLTPAPVFDSARAANDHGVLASAALIQDDGTWAMWYYTWEATVWPVAPSRIWRATAPAPEGPWTPDATPALEPGADDSFDAGAVRTPSVLRDADGYRMWFTAVDRRGVSTVGYATSTDGLTWVKHPSPVLTPTGGTAFDGKSVLQPRVTAGPDGFVMTYAGAVNFTTTSYRQSHGLAVSQDGITWRRGDGAVVKASDFPGGGQLWYSALVWTGEDYLLLPEVGHGGTTEVFAARHHGPLSIGG